MKTLLVPLSQQTSSGLSAPRSSRFAKCLGATVFAGALALGSTTAAVAEERGAPTGATCPEDTFCVDSTNKTTTNSVPKLTLGDGQDSPFALSPGGSIMGGFDVKNTGSQEARVVVAMAWANERCVGASFADDPFLMSLPHPDGKTTFYSPGMDANITYDGGGMVAESLRCNGTRETTVLTVPPGETLAFGARIAFPFMENGNDTQKEKVSIEFRIRLEVDEPNPNPTPIPNPEPPTPTPTPEPSPTPTPEIPNPNPSVDPNPSVVPNRPSRPGLASTGVNLTGMTVGVGGLAVAGGLLLLVHRRKRQD